MNPKSISMDELYGFVDLITFEWSDGLAPSIIRRFVDDDEGCHQWIIFDGPVDAMWIENMNSVLDDNKLLCLANSERIKLTNSIEMMFEVQDLAVASPATVSRCGMVYVPPELSWRSVVKTWMGKAAVLAAVAPEVREHLWKLFDTVDGALAFNEASCTEDFPTVPINLVHSLCNLFESMYKPGAAGVPVLRPPQPVKVEGQEELSVTDEARDVYQSDIETAKVTMDHLFFLSFVWSLGGSLNQDSWPLFDAYLKGM
jgi:dynein heavy chain